MQRNGRSCVKNSHFTSVGVVVQVAYRGWKTLLMDAAINANEFYHVRRGICVFLRICNTVKELVKKQ
eukprot:scaffold4448_cov149-Skeletonema_dohrnii-CCMP3373.AAC.2